MKFRIIPSVIAVVLSLVIGLILGMVASNDTHDGLRVTVEGNFGAPVNVTVSGRISPDQQKMLLIRGDGHLLEENMQILFRVSNFAYTKGGYLSTINDVELRAGNVTEKELGDLYSLVHNVPEGSRVMAIFPDKSRANAEIVVIDILPTINRGESRELNAMPAGVAVTSDSQGIPEVITDGSKITKSHIGVLLVGDGEQIAQGDHVYVNYVMASADGALLENTYEDPAPVFVDMDQIFSGLADALIDQRVGSRIVAAFPQVDAQGEGDVVLVVDILARAENEGTSSNAESSNAESSSIDGEQNAVSGDGNRRQQTEGTQ